MLWSTSDDIGSLSVAIKALGGNKKERTFVIKAVYPVDTGALVIASKDEKVFWIFDFVRKEEADGFEGLFSSVDVIAQE